MNDMKQKDNTMRETPETDAAFRDGYTFCAEDMMPAVAFCANLECERDEARELVRELRDALELALEHVEPGVWIPHKSGDPNLERLLSCVLAEALAKAKEVLGEA